MTEERFWELVNKDGNCWEWQGWLHPKGYGYASWKGKTMSVQRVAYMVRVGEIPPGFDVCHSCDNRRCVNPAHLFVGTRSENNRDSVRKGRWMTPARFAAVRKASHSVKANRRGSSNNAAKLTDEEVMWIKSLRGMVSANRLGRACGVWSSTIQRIWNGVGWTHLEGSSMVGTETAGV